jgi:hypothetical protein
LVGVGKVVEDPIATTAEEGDTDPPFASYVTVFPAKLQEATRVLVAFTV